MAEFRWGVIGAGKIARTMVSDMLGAGIRVDAVASRDLANAQAFAGEFSLPKAYCSYLELVSDPDIDIVYIATPQAMHRDNALLAISHGKHVLVEKSFALNASQAQDVRVAAEAAGVFAQEAMWTRFLPMHLRIREIIESGSLGRPLRLVADFSRKFEAVLRERLRLPELGAGALLDIGVYPVAFANQFFGAPTSIAASGTIDELGVDLAATIEFGYSSGASASLEYSMLENKGVEATIEFERGRIEIATPWFEQTTFEVFGADGSLVESYSERNFAGRGMQFQALDLEARLAAGQRDSELIPISETVKIMAVMDEIRRQLGVVYPGE
jgi:predicted dehydrogenase